MRTYRVDMNIQFDLELNGQLYDDPVFDRLARIVMEYDNASIESEASERESK